MNDSLFIKKSVVTLIILFIILIVGIGIYLSYINNWWQGSKNINTSNFSNNDLINPSTTALPSLTPSITLLPTTSPTGIALTPTPPNYLVSVYFSKHPNSDDDPAKVYPLQRVSHTLGVATFAINELIKGPTLSESANAYYSAVEGTLYGASNCSGSDFKISLNKKGTITESGTATIQFCRNIAIPGELAGARIQTEIQQTLLQFSTIKKVIILNKDSHCFNDLSGMNLCLK